MRVDLVEPEWRCCEAVFGVVSVHLVEDSCAEGGVAALECEEVESYVMGYSIERGRMKQDIEGVFG